jgi:hypothetical protein
MPDNLSLNDKGTIFPKGIRLLLLLLIAGLLPLAANEPADSPPRASVRIEGGALMLSFATRADAVYRVEFSSRLREWIEQVSLQGTGGRMDVPVGPCDEMDARFFRVSRLPSPEPFDIASVRLFYQNHDFAQVRVITSTAATATVAWGIAPDALTNTASCNCPAAMDQLIELHDLPLDAAVYYRVHATNESGYRAEGDIQSFDTPAVAMLEQVSRHGITWTFDQPYPAGQFVNGDWWVVGPVVIADIDPAPGPIPPEEDISDVIDYNQYHTTSLRASLEWKNGSMIVPAPGSNYRRQAYDSRNSNYNRNLRFMVGDTLPAGQSLMSSISHLPETGYPAQVVYHNIMWASEKQGARVLRTAAVLTCLDAVPPGDAFRPAYVRPAAGTAKEVFNARDIQWHKLQRLPPPDAQGLPSAEHPSWSDYERYFERVWLDQVCGHWSDQRFVPSENQPYYGREYARLVGTASLMLHLDVPQARKTTLLYRLLQLGIDLRGLAMRGATWNEGGGLTSGRKWPILFAGLMFNADYAWDLPEGAVFHEDAQTYWGEGWHGQRALYQMMWHSGPRLTFQEQSPFDYPDWDTGGALGGKSWGIRSEEYRCNTTVRAWPGQTLAALLMNAKAIWNHDSYFEVVDDWMRLEDIYTDNRGDLPRPDPSNQPYPAVPGLDPALVQLWTQAPETTANDAFVTWMWHAYRDTDAVPPQPHGTEHRRWNPFGGGQPRDPARWQPNDRLRWESNPMPAAKAP